MTAPDHALLVRLLADAPSVVRLVAVAPDGRLLGAAGGPVADDAGRAVARLWEAASRAAAMRSPAPLDHLVMRTEVGGVALVHTHGLLLAAVPRDGVRPDLAACEVRRVSTLLDTYENGATNASVGEG